MHQTAISHDHQHGLHAIAPIVEPAVATQKTVEATRTPKIGDDVLYVLSSGRSKGEVRPGKVVRVWNAATVNLIVFTDATNDFDTSTLGSNGILWATSVHFAPVDSKELHTWHWPGKEA